MHGTRSTCELQFNQSEIHNVIVTDLNPTFRLKRFPAAPEACEVLDFIILLPCRFWAWVLFFFTESCGLSSVSLLLALDLLTPFASLAAKVRYLNIWPCLFSPLCCIRLRRPKVEKCHVDRPTEPRSEWTKPKTSVKQKSSRLGFFYFGFWEPRIFEIGRNATYT